MIKKILADRSSGDPHSGVTWFCGLGRNPLASFTGCLGCHCNRHRISASKQSTAQSCSAQLRPEVLRRFYFLSRREGGLSRLRAAAFRDLRQRLPGRTGAHAAQSGSIWGREGPGSHRCLSRDQTLGHRRPLAGRVDGRPIHRKSPGFDCRPGILGFVSGKQHDWYHQTGAIHFRQQRRSGNSGQNRRIPRTAACRYPIRRHRRAATMLNLAATAHSPGMAPPPFPRNAVGRRRSRPQSTCCKGLTR